MILSIIIIAVLLLEFIKGYNIGLVRRLLSIIGTVVSLLVAVYYQSQFGNWMLENIQHIKVADATSIQVMFSRFLAFFIIMLVGKMVFSVFRHRRYDDRKNVLSFADRLFGGLFSLIISYVLVFIVLSMLNELQIDWFITQTLGSPVAKFILYDTPWLTPTLFHNVFNISNLVKI